MERSVCRTSLRAGVLAQLSIIGRLGALLRQVWPWPHTVKCCGQVHRPRTSVARTGILPDEPFSGALWACPLAYRHQTKSWPRPDNYSRGDPSLNDLLSLNATDFTKAVKHGLTCPFVHRPSSAGPLEGQEMCA
jgi:hypothetical protein